MTESGIGIPDSGNGIRDRVKSDGAWRIAHRHESVPFYMDGSNRAAVDLTP